MCLPIADLLPQSPLFPILNPIEIKIVLDYDLYAIYGIEPINLRELSVSEGEISNHLAKQKSIFEFILKISEIVDISKVENYTFIRNYIAGRIQNESTNLKYFLDQNINSENRELLKIYFDQAEYLDYSGKDLNAYAQEVITNFPLIERIVKDINILQAYEDLWFASRAVSLSSDDFFDIRDELSVIGLNIFPSKESLNSMSQYIEKDIFDGRDLNQTTKDEIKTLIGTLQKEHNQEDIRSVFASLSSFNLSQINSIYNFFNIISASRNKQNANLKLWTGFYEISYEVIKKLTAIENVKKIQEKYSNASTEEDLVNYQSDMIELFVILLEQVDLVEVNEFVKIVLKTQINYIRDTILYLQVIGLEILLTGTVGESGIFNINIITNKSLPLIFEAYYEELSALTLDGNIAEGIKIRMSNHFETKLALINKIKTLSDQNFLVIRHHRNDQLNNIIYDKVNADTSGYADWNGIIISLIDNYNDIALEKYSEEKISQFLLSSRVNFNEFTSKLTEMYRNLINSYNEFLKLLAEKNFDISEHFITAYKGEDKQNVLEIFQFFTETTSLGNTLGFRTFWLQKNLVTFEFNEDLLRFYLGGN